MGRALSPDLGSRPAGSAADEAFEIRTVSGADAAADAPGDLIVEIPHGATELRHFEAVHRRLAGDLPPDLEAFFFVNTDVGAPECAARIAALLTGAQADSDLEVSVGGRAAAPRLKVLVLRCLVPRTLVDCNRVVDAEARGLTPAIPGYVEEEEDRELLRRLHRSYHDAAERAYARVCGNGGLALQLHTYAPRAVQVERIDAGIVQALRRAYEPGVYERWPRRPDVDLITRASDGAPLAPERLVAAVLRGFARSGIEATECATYRLDPATMGHRYSAAYPGRVLCVEINRELVADPFVPFRAVRIAGRKVARVCRPLAAGLLEELAAAHEDA